ncbi:hypothetical protein ES708_21080 [subsurface metagenome]
MPLPRGEVTSLILQVITTIVTKILLVVKSEMMNSAFQMLSQKFTEPM